MQRYYGIAQDRNGNVIPSAAVTVKLAGTGTLATLYSDDVYTPLANPFTSETDGAYQFYVRNGRYDVTLVKTGSTFDADDTADTVLFDPASTLSPPQITSNQNDYTPTNGLNVSIWRLTSDAARTITGIAAGFSGQRLTISNVGSFALTFANSSGSSIAANQIITGTGSDISIGASGMITIVYDASTSRWRTVSVNAGTVVPVTGIFTSPGAIVGLTMSNSTIDSTNDIDITVGAATSSDATLTDRDSMYLQTAITKQLNVNWAVGTNQGGLDTGVVANDTYHVFLIKRTDTGVVDVLFSLSPTAPTMPANYNKSRRIGSFFRTGGTNVPFSHRGDQFLLKTPILDQSAAAIDGTAALYALSVPNLIKVDVIFNLFVPGGVSHYYSSPDVNDDAPSTTVAPLLTLRGEGGAEGSGLYVIRTNTSRQIRGRASAATTTNIATLGWYDDRAKYD